MHNQTFRDLNTSQTALSKHIWDLRSQGIEAVVTWKIIDRGRPFSPVHGVCQLCNKEKFYILFRPDVAELNSRSETFSACRHIKPALLIKKPRKSKKKSPGSWTIIWKYVFILSQSIINFWSLRIAVWHETLSSNKDYDSLTQSDFTNVICL